MKIKNISKLEIGNKHFRLGNYEKSIECYSEYSSVSEKHKSLVKYNIDLALRKIVEVESNRIVVSIICVTFNHKAYIADAIEGMLNQNCNFKYEILIGDDASIDGTSEIIDSYSSKYPDKIVYVKRLKNIGATENFFDLLSRASGKYIAINDGDDYITDVNKLQKQVDFLRVNQSYTMVFHPVRVLYEDNPDLTEVFPGSNGKTIWSKNDLVYENFISSVSVMYRFDALKPHLSDINKKAFPLDYYLHFLASTCGKIGMVDSVMAVYRKNRNGVFSSLASPDKILIKWGREHIFLFKEMKKYCSFEENVTIDNNINYVVSKLVEHHLDNVNYDSLNELYDDFKDDVSKYIESTYNIEVDTEKVSNLSLYLKSKNTVTAIVTSYNHIKTIEECINSVVHQKGFFSLKIHLSDDCSTDGTFEFISNKYSTLKNVEIAKHHNNLGLVKNLEYCITKSTSQYTAFCEGDDKWMSRYKINKQLFKMLKHQNAGLVFNWLLLNIDHKYFIPHEEQSRLSSKIFNKHLQFSNCIGNFSCCFYRTKALKSLPREYFEFDKSADWLMNLLISKDYEVIFLKEILSEYYINPNGLWSSLSDNSKNDLIRETIDKYRFILGFKEVADINIFDENNFCNEVVGYIQELHFDGNSLHLSGWVFSLNTISTSFSKKTIYIATDNQIIGVGNSDSIERKDVKDAYSHIDYKNTLFSGFQQSIIAPLKDGVDYNIIVSICDGDSQSFSKIHKFRVN